MTIFSPPIIVTEEGEAIGILRQFARSLNLSVSALREALETEARDCIIFSAGVDPDGLLILDPCGLPTLLTTSRVTHQPLRIDVTPR